MKKWFLVKNIYLQTLDNLGPTATTTTTITPTTKTTTTTTALFLVSLYKRISTNEKVFEKENKSYSKTINNKRKKNNKNGCETVEKKETIKRRHQLSFRLNLVRQKTDQGVVRRIHRKCDSSSSFMTTLLRGRSDSISRCVGFSVC